MKPTVTKLPYYARVLNREHLEPIKDFLAQIRPMKAVFDRRFVRNLDGTHVKEGQEPAQPTWKPLRKTLPDSRPTTDWIAAS